MDNMIDILNKLKGFIPFNLIPPFMEEENDEKQVPEWTVPAWMVPPLVPPMSPAPVMVLE